MVILPSFIPIALGTYVASQQGLSLIGGAAVALIVTMVLGAIAFAALDIR